jgi:hypothetical protein
MSATKPQQNIPCFMMSERKAFAFFFDIYHIMYFTNCAISAPSFFSSPRLQVIARATVFFYG